MPQTQINLLPDSAKVKFVTNPFLTWFANFGIYLVFIAYVITIGGLIYRNIQENKLKALYAEINTKVAEIQRSQKFVIDYGKLQEQYRVLGATIKSISPKNEILTIIKNTIPVPISINSVRIDATSVTIDAFTLEYNAVYQWYSSLNSEKKLKSVEIVSISRDTKNEDTKGQVSFTIKISY